MKNLITSLFSSKKFVVALSGILAALLARWLAPEASEEIANVIVNLAAAFCVGQGLSDFGKEAKKLE